MTIANFTKKYFESLSARFPSAKFKIVNDSTIIAEAKGNEINISADNAYRGYVAEPDSLQEILSKYVSIIDETLQPPEKADIARIIPIIKPLSYLEDLQKSAKEIGATKEVESVYEKYNDQLIIVYAEDTKNSISYLMQDDIKALSINKDSLRTIAINNLDKLLTSIKRQGENGVYMLTAGGDYEASIILLNDIFSKESLPVKGDYVIAIPNRDMLLVTGSNDVEGISKIKKLTKSSFEQGDYNVSEYLYKWNGRIFEKFE